MMGPDDFQDHRRYDLTETEPEADRRLEEVADELWNELNYVLDTEIGVDATGPYLELVLEPDGVAPPDFPTADDVESVAEQYDCRVVSSSGSPIENTFEVRPP